MRKIKLQGKNETRFATVDNDDFVFLSCFKWHFCKRGKTYYAVRRNPADGKTGLYMHRFIMRAKKGQMIDHVDMNGLNNQRKNLRFSTHSLNALNQNGHRDSVTGARGVSKSGSKFIVKIMRDGVERTFGSFSTISQAKAVHKKALLNLLK